MFMVPNLTLLLDLRKPNIPPLKVFEKVVELPVKYNVPVITVFLDSDSLFCDCRTSKMLERTSIFLEWPQKMRFGH